MNDLLRVVSTVVFGATGKGTLTGDVLTCLVKTDNYPGYPGSIAALSRQVGANPTTTMREVDRLVDLGLVVWEQNGRARRVRFNHESPFAAPVLELLFIAYGVWPPSARWRGQLDEALEDHAEQDGVSNYIPRFLLTGRGSRSSIPLLGPDDGELQEDVFDGPTPVDARRLISVVRSLHSKAVSLEKPLHESYRRWRRERDRDLIHIVAAGDGTRYAAAHLLSGSIARQAVAAGAISRNEWARAVFGVWAEFRKLREIADHLDGVIEYSARWASLATRDSYVGSLPVDEHTPLRLQREEERLERNRAEADAAKAAFDALYRPGRQPRIDSVANAGERMLAVTARDLSVRLEALVAEMASHSSFVEWRDAHRSYLRADHPGSSAGSECGRPESF